jgi:hypothetical protein
MRFHFKLDGLDHQHRDTLLSIESVMTGRSSTALFDLKALDVFTNRDPVSPSALNKTNQEPIRQSWKMPTRLPPCRLVVRVYGAKAERMGHLIGDPTP